MKYQDIPKQDPPRVAGTPISVIPALRRHISQVLQGGLPVLLRKGRIALRLAPDLPGLFLALPVVLLVRLMRPFVVVRFGPIRSPNFGHFASEPELYLSKREVGLDDSRSSDIFYYTSRPGGLPMSNQQLKKMWDRTLRVNRLARWPDWVNRSLPGGSRHMVPPGNTRDIHGCMNHTRPHLVFTPEEERRGQEGLRKLGIPEGAPFVGFHARDPAWLDTLAPGLDYTYHNLRDSNIQNYIPAVRMLVDRGCYGVRMGSVVTKPLNCSDPKIIDYAANGSRTDFMDIYLGAKCRFFIGSAAGITELPKAFRRPIVSVNTIPLAFTHSWCPNDVFIPKKLWHRPEGRFLTFRETLVAPVGWRPWGAETQDISVEPVENTPEDITAAVLEMEERLNGTWQTSREDDELQHRFWALFGELEGNTHSGEPLHGVIAAHIGAEFLRSNRDLLD